MLSQLNRFAFNSSRSFLKNNLFKTIPQRTFGTAAAAPASKDAMFCFQCEQTRDNVGCKTVGVCGKTPEVAALQDLLIHSIKGISSYAKKAAELGARDVSTDQFVLTALFSTLTNVNFDASRFVSYLNEAEQRLETSRKLYEQAAKKAGVKPELSRTSFTDFKLSDRSNVNKLVEQARPIGVDARKELNGADYTGLQELITYGLKGTCAYAHHAMVMGEEDPAVYKVIHDCLEFLTHSDKKVEELLKVALTVGDVNLKVMQMLDQGHTKRFGHPEPTKVRTTPVAGKAIAVSGHDLRDLEELLKQTEGKNINVYTHGEILPAHGYPGLRKYKHLVGNYGGPWQLQQFEFANFPGSILMTSNCIIEPRKSYKNRIFTRDMVGWPGVPHISGTTGRDKVDFTPVIETALAEEGFEETVEPAKYTTTGFGRNAILASAGAIVDAVKKGDLKHFFLIGGCDGAEGERNYFKEVAMNTPKDSVILTLACGKYRFNMQEHGTVAGLPRMLDIGQCNDAHSAIQVASALAQAFGTDVNSLPLSFVISWFEQKAVAVLLSLLSLNIKNIYLGPNLPAFATPNMLKILVDAYGLKKIGNPKSDLQAMLNRK